jgi:hypothetical protein
VSLDLNKSLPGMGFATACCENECVCLFYISTSRVSYLTINQQFGREATKTHSDQRQVMSENGLVF